MVGVLSDQTSTCSKAGWEAKLTFSGIDEADEPVKLLWILILDAKSGLLCFLFQVFSLLHACARSAHLCVPSKALAVPRQNIPIDVRVGSCELSMIYRHRSPAHQRNRRRGKFFEICHVSHQLSAFEHRPRRY
jgi:hypothetical protein